MATRVEIVEEEIRKLSVAIEGLKTQWKETNDKDEKKYLGDQISAETGLMIAKQNTLTALITSQQRKFHYIFQLLFSTSSRCKLLPNLFRHILFTHPGSASTEGKTWCIMPGCGFSVRKGCMR